MKEEWRTYPEIDFIQGSNLGNVRTIGRYIKTKNGLRQVSDHVLKQHRNRNGYMQVTTSINGKTVSISVHRIIATCFLPNPDGLPEVNHIDSNRTNNRVENLEWCTRKYNCQYRNKHGISYSEAAKKHPVIAINLKTLEVLRFSSQTEAEKNIGVDCQSIGQVVSNKAKQAGGYYFMDDNGSDIEMDKDELRKIVAGRKPDYSILGVNLDTQTVYIFPSRSEAGRIIGIDQSTVGKVIKGKRNKTKGFWFTKADGNAVDNANNRLRKLIGDKINSLVAGDDSKKVAEFIAGLKLSASKLLK